MVNFLRKIVYGSLLVPLACALAVTVAPCGAATLAGALPFGGGSYVKGLVREGEALSARVHLGGQLVGFTIDFKGVMVDGLNEVDTPAGKATLKADLRAGDIILEVNGRGVETAEDITAALNESGGKAVVLTVRREGETISVPVSPLIDRISGEYRLGASVRSETGGIGTVTYVRQDGRFAALGHAAGAASDGEINGGKVYGCRLVGIERGAKGRAGSIRGMLDRRAGLGTVDKSIRYGVYGNLAAGEEGELYDVAGREQVTVGGAKLVSEISGRREFYDVEIVKTAYQTAAEERGMVIKVTDKRLLDLTGGIIQGMSGSPLVQNGRLVGAVTHVFINDPKSGYGIYLDWMIGN